MSTSDQLEKIRTNNSFVAALDQSGGSTPTALASYGVDRGAWSNDEDMFALIHEMRTRVITSPSFTGDRILAAILFEDTMDRRIDDLPTVDFLWHVKNIVPILKVDKGLKEEEDGVQRMKPIPDLGGLLTKARASGVFGTKMRSVIKNANQVGIEAVVDQQFTIAKDIIASGLVPIIEPEIDINSPQKSEAERLLKTEILRKLGEMSREELVMLKLTLPEEDDFYVDCVRHPNVLKVLALSGGYPRGEANARLSRNHGVVASFSRALTEGLQKQQSDEEFDALLKSSIESIYRASQT